LTLSSSDFIFDLQADSLQVFHFLLSADRLTIIDHPVQPSVAQLQIFKIIFHFNLLAKRDIALEIIYPIEL